MDTEYKYKTKMVKIAHKALGNTNEEILYVIVYLTRIYYIYSLTAFDLQTPTPRVLQLRMYILVLDVCT